MSDTYKPAELTNDNGTVLAKVSVFGEKMPPGCKRYTAFVTWSAGREIEEEIDLDALNAEHARAAAKLELENGYEPGARIVSVEERWGLYL
jgi:Ribonuclease G/E